MKKKFKAVYFRYLLCLPWSVVFNFHYLPFKQAVKFPILFQVIPTFLFLSGRVKIVSDDIRVGMVRIGEQAAPFYKRRDFRWKNLGTVIFKGKVRLGHHTFISVGPDGYLEIGDKSTFSHELRMICEKKIVLEDRCRVSWGCTFIDTDFHPLIDLVRNEPIPKSSPIVMGRGVWIGHDCIISKGSRLAENTTVSSGSVVKGRFKKPNTIVGGNPAVVIDEGYVRDDV